MRPIQWHLKNNWHIPESLEKFIPIARSLHHHLRWWLEDQVLLGQPLHPLQHALQIFTDASNEGWGAHLGDHTTQGVWSVPESRLHINFLELKAVLLALKQFEQLCRNEIVLIASDNTTVVSYINKEGGMRSGSLCALLWRLLSWCNHRQIILQARHIPGRLNVIADKLSRHHQVIQTEWSLHQEVFNQICNKWHWPQIDLFATRYNNKLPKFVSPVPDQKALAIDALSLLGGTGSLRVSPSSAPGEGDSQAPGTKLQEVHPDSPRLARDAVVLGSGDTVNQDSITSSDSRRPSDSAVQQDPTQGSPQSDTARLAPRVTAIREQRFSNQVATRIEAPQRSSTRTVYEAKWSIFLSDGVSQIRWTSPHLL